MDTLQASHATSSSFRSAPQSTAVASTRGNIVVPPKREIHGPGEPSTGLIRDGSPHRKQPPKREIHGPGEPSTGRYKYDHPGYQSTGQSHMPLPKRPHRSPNSDANKTCPVPGFARDVVTVRSAVDLLGGGPGRQSTARDYSGPCPRGGIDLSRYLGNDFDLRSSAAPGVRGRRGGERILPHFFTSKSWEHRNPSTENVAPRRAPGDDSTTARPRRRGVVTAIPPGHHSSGSFAGTERAVRRRNEETANPPPGPDRRVVVTPAPPEHHLSRYDATPLSRGTERVVRRRNEETANPPPDRTASGRDPGSAGAPPPRYDATPLSRGTERVVRRRNEETANPPPGPDRRVVVTPAPPEHHLSRYDATPLSRGTERVVRRRNEETANPPPGPDRRVVVTPAPPEHHLSRYDATPLSRGTERVVRRRNEETANPPPGPDRRVVVTPAPPEHHLSRYDATPLSRGTERVVRRRNEETANPPLDRTGECRDSDSAGARRVPFRSEAPAREVPRRNAGTASTPPGPGRATSRYTKTREGSSRALIRGPSTSFVHSHPAPRARGELLSNLGSAARSSTHLPLYRATGVPAILETFFVSGALRHDACRRGGEGTESRAVS
ncbi:hypothetical protein TNCT_355541 [Trichonephila clavata]|uniref:Uncharacterized protein n=1 Tax=Trichonephila clavata TaxID=2740835 RepID=A0A8X6KF39_TRICU|nr:hypothetical protein TNCT_355541 [Trichonephila clavata]